MVKNVLKKKNKDLFETYDLNKQIEKIQNRKIWLKCGEFDYQSDKGCGTR